MKFAGRYYLDHNAQSPLSSSLKEWLSRGDLFLSNADSRHLSGQKSKSLVSAAADYLNRLFNPQNAFDLVFHSGATEGLGGISRSLLLRMPNAPFYYLIFDHAVAQGISERESSHRPVRKFLGDPLTGIWSEADLHEIKQSKAPAFVHWTWINNESSAIASLALAIELKKNNSELFISVDAAQAIGREFAPGPLPTELDAYTFSGHKFGSLPGVGFSFINRRHSPLSWSEGGGQSKWRSGTLNVPGIHSLQLALADLQAGFNSETLKKIHHQFTNFFSNEFPLVRDLGRTFPTRAHNCLFLHFPNIPNDRLLMALSLAGLDVSAGSACHSGSSLPNRVAMALGLDEAQAKDLLRISWDYRLLESDLPEILGLFKTTLHNLGLGRERS